MRIHKVLALALLTVAAACFLPACTTPDPNFASENTQGAYLAPKDSPYYKANKGTLYAWDGSAWYILKSPQTSAGDIGGADAGRPERWVRAGESEVQSYCRTPATFRNQSLRPIFLPY